NATLVLVHLFLCLSLPAPPPRPPPFPYTTLFRSPVALDPGRRQRAGGQVIEQRRGLGAGIEGFPAAMQQEALFDVRAALKAPRPDRKSTRLNSSHVKISYAVFCLKKKK